MGKGSRARRGKIKHTKEAPKPVDEMSPVAERYKSYHHEGRWLGHGIEGIDVEMLSSGQITGRAHINRLEASALDGLKQAGVLDDPRDENAVNRRHAAGELLREIFNTAKIESSSTGHYDKVTNEMLPGGAPHPKSNKALDHEVEYHRLMRLCMPYHTVVRNVCCHNERPPMVVRDGQARPCNWDEALRRGLDIIADDKFADTDRKKPGRRMRSTGLMSA